MKNTSPNTILILTDSLGAPRPGTAYQKTWVHHIIEEYRAKCHCFAYTERALTSPQLAALVKEKFCLYSPDLVIIQVGLADCAPRALTQKEQAIISKIPLVSPLIKILIKRYYGAITRRRNICYVSKDLYKDSIEKIAEAFPRAQKIVIPIITPCDAYIQKSPLIEERIRNYSHALYELQEIQVLETVDALPKAIINHDFYVEDHHHLSERGHNYYAEKISLKIKEWMNQ